MSEVFEYVSTTKDVDYAKYFAYAGLQVDVTAQDAPGAYLGVNTDTLDGKLVVASSSAGSPARAAGLAAHDEIVEAAGARATPNGLNDLLTAKKPGETIKLRISRAGAAQDLEVVLAQNTKRTFAIQPMLNPDPLQAAILNDWLRSAQ